MIDSNIIFCIYSCIHYCDDFYRCLVYCMSDWISNSSEGTENEQVPNAYIFHILNRKYVASCVELGMFYSLAYLIASLTHFWEELT